MTTTCSGSASGWRGPTCPARKILEGLNAPSGPHSRPRPEHVAEGLALMAADRVETDPAGARKLLDEAFDRLRKVASESYRGNNPWVSNCMAGLLPLCKRIAPDRLEERLWLAAAYLAPLFEPRFLNEVEAPVVLAALVARGTTGRWPRPSLRLP